MHVLVKYQEQVKTNLKRWTCSREWSVVKHSYWSLRTDLSEPWLSPTIVNHILHEHAYYYFIWSRKLLRSREVMIENGWALQFNAFCTTTTTLNTHPKSNFQMMLSSKSLMSSSRTLWGYEALVFKKSTFTLYWTVWVLSHGTMPIEDVSQASVSLRITALQRTAKERW